ncbi:hypothetical protein A9Q94_03095 [Rhodobacterales bacterium 56_14_T64]|nr:hypothetical protein A9Q94_03095 [Rhodobacterales bacterium 56_14_T64]
MTSNPKAAEIEFASMQEMQALVAKLRQRGLRSPRDQWVIEACSVSFFSVPILLALSGSIDRIALVAFFIGYLYLRWFDRVAKPVLQRKFAPKELLPDGLPMKVRVSSGGLRIEHGENRAEYSWSCVAINKVTDLGYIFRIEPERALALPFDKLPPDWNADRLIAEIETWTTRNIA